MLTLPHLSALLGSNRLPFRYVVGDSLAAATFSRPTVGTQIDANGVVQTAAANTARDGHYIGGVRTLLLEGQRTNLDTQSSPLLTPAWSVATATATTNAATAPDGTLTATKLVSSVTGGYPSINQNPTVVASGTYTLTCDVEAAEQTDVQFEIRYSSGDNTTPDATFTLTGAGTATVVDSSIGSPVASIERLGATNWYRCRLTKTNPSTGTTAVVIIKPGSSPVNGQGIYVWGAQFEAGASPSSYIATAGFSVSRSADSLYFPWLYSPAEMSLYADFVELGTSLVNATGLFAIIDAAGSGTPRLQVTSNGTNAYTVQYSNGTATAIANGTLATSTGDRVRLRAVLRLDGSVLIGTSINGGAENVVSSAAPAGGLASTWAAPRLYVGSKGSNAGFAAFNQIKGAFGIQSLDWLAAA